MNDRAGEAGSQIETTDCDIESSVVDWLIDHPQSLAILRQLGVDYTCGGKSLEMACRERGLDPREVAARLRDPSAARVESHPMPERNP